MDSIFENKFVLTNKMCKKIFNFGFFHRSKILIFDIMLVLIGVYFLVQTLLSKDNGIIAIVICVALLLAQLFMYFLLLLKSMAAYEKLGDGQPISEERVVTDECIRFSTSVSGAREVLYKEIESVCQYKDLIILTAKMKNIYFLKKDAFTKGTAEEFIEFIKTKGIKIVEK